jgi:diguanylate cyclase (GGDEF)-like protein
MSDTTDHAPGARPAKDTISGLMRSGRFRVLGAAVVIACVGLFAGALVLRGGSAYSALWDSWVAQAALLVSVAACFASAVVNPLRRAAAIWLGLGMLSFTAGNVIYVGWTQFQSEPPVPSPADLAYLGIYPCILAMLLSLVRREKQALTRSMWLDGGLGAAGAATALAAVLSPVISGLEGDLAQVLVGAAFPVADLLMIGSICGLLAVRGARGGSMWVLLVAGLAIFCAAEVIYALRLVTDTYVVGTFVDAMWAIGLAVMALALWRPDSTPATDPGRSAAILTVPLLATIVATLVLVVGSLGQVSMAAIALATITLGLVALRTLISFRQVQRLSDAHHQAITDELTGLGNRRCLFESGARALAAVSAPDRLALVMIDLDNFKDVNDALGHHAGDEVLRETAARLADCASPGDVLVRLGGDEFALLFPLAPGHDGQDAAESLLARVSRPVIVEGTSIRLEASVGVAQSRPLERNVADLLRRADLAMYSAKSGNLRVTVYDPQLDADNAVRLRTMQELETAFAQKQFVLHYQPKVDLRTGASIGAEALVRWQHPQRGLLYPDAFLPLVEQSGLIGALTRQVLAGAIGQVAAWRAEGMEVTVAVNLSATDLLDATLAPEVARLLKMHDVPADALELEITESVLMSDPECARTVLESLQRLGLRIAIDDYGTGYSSLAYLRDLPVDELKIDRTFVARVTSDPRSAAIVRSTVELGHALGFEVVAEGVEDAATLDVLLESGCDLAQGYLFSRPVPADVFAASVKPGTVPVGPRVLGVAVVT